MEAELKKALRAVTGEDHTVYAAGRTDAGTETAAQLARTIRNDYIPRAGFPPGEGVLLTGAPAFGLDFIDTAYAAFPWLLAAVLVITYFVLLRAFRSIVLPLKAVIMNLLSIGASYGVIVAVFQWGWFDWTGYHSLGHINTLNPALILAITFGLAMDYEVFLLSRIRERYEATGDNTRAVAEGLASSARTISFMGNTSPVGLVT